MVYESEGTLHTWLSDQEQPDLFGGLGITMFTPEVPPVVDEVVEGSPAEAVGLRSGDQVLRADGEEMRLWMQWVEYVRARPGEPIELEFRAGVPARWGASAGHHRP
jgi:regulator of sigma E protease